MQCYPQYKSQATLCQIHVVLIFFISSAENASNQNVFEDNKCRKILERTIIQHQELFQDVINLKKNSTAEVKFETGEGNFPSVFILDKTSDDIIRKIS